MSDKYAYVMMIHDKWWQGFLDLHLKGKKTFSYVQSANRAPPKKNPSLLFFYVTNPVRAIEGYAEFIENRIGDAESLWKDFGDESALRTKMKYDAFTKDMKTVSFVRFKNIRKTTNPISLRNIPLLLGIHGFPRRGRYISKEEAEKLISLMNE